MPLPFFVTGARAALRTITGRGQIGRIAQVIGQVGRGPPAMGRLRSIFRGYPRSVRQYVLNWVGQGVGLQPRPGRRRLFLKDIPVVRGLFGDYTGANRVRYGVRVTWRDAISGQTGEVFRQLDYDRPQLTDQLAADAGERVGTDITGSPTGFGLSGQPQIEILGVENVYTFRSF